MPISGVLKRELLDDTVVPAGGATLRLYTVMPNADGTGGTELTGGGYAGLATTQADWGAASGTSNTSMANTADFEWTASGADFTGVAGVAIDDGTRLTDISAFASPITVTDGNTLRIATGAYVVNANNA